MEAVVLVLALLAVVAGLALLFGPVVRRVRHHRDPAAVQRARLAEARRTVI
jgi:hypothetical protein